MELKINLQCDHDKMNNFTMADAIYKLYTDESNNLDLIAICEMLNSQRAYDEYKHDMAEAENRPGYRPRRTRYQNY